MNVELAGVRWLSTAEETMDKDLLREETFRPYSSGQGPSFELSMWDSGRTDRRGQTIIGYRLEMHAVGGEVVSLFEAADFAGSPLHADDSDATVRALMTFLTLRPGDVEAEYFEDYSDEQRAFCADHAEALAMTVAERFGEG